MSKWDGLKSGRDVNCHTIFERQKMYTDVQNACVKDCRAGVSIVCSLNTCIMTTFIEDIHLINSKTSLKPLHVTTIKQGTRLAVIG